MIASEWRRGLVRSGDVDRAEANEERSGSCVSDTAGAEVRDATPERARPVDISEAIIWATVP
jgi:hypothetical protein